MFGLLLLPLLAQAGLTFAATLVLAPKLVVATLLIALGVITIIIGAILHTKL